MHRSKETLQQAPQNKRKESYGPGLTERKDKTTVAGCPNEKRTEPQTLKGYRGERVGDGLSPRIRRAADFRNIQGGSAISWNTVTTTGCDRRVNRGRGRRTRGVTQRGEPLSRGDASHSG